MTVSGGTFNYNAGTMGGAGTLSLSATVANFTPNFSNATTTLRLVSSSTPPLPTGTQSGCPGGSSSAGISR